MGHIRRMVSEVKGNRIDKVYDRILLVNPQYTTNYGFKRAASSSLPPLGLLSIAAFLREHLNLEPVFVDLDYEDDYNRFINIVRKSSGYTIIVGIYITDISVDAARKLTSIIKSLNPYAVVIGGGPHICRETAKASIERIGIDVAVLGEGELIMKEIVENMRRGSEIDNLLKSEKIRGIAARIGKTTVLKDGYNIVREIDRLPYPAYDIVRWDRYRPSLHRRIGKRTLPILTSRGCPYRCSYCATSRNYRAHSVKYIEGLIELLVETYNIDSLMIWDDTFTINVKRLEQICKVLYRNNLSFCINTRPDTVNKSTLNLLAKSGCKIIFFGIESASDYMLKKLKRGYSRNVVEKAVRNAASSNILVVGSFMIGHPYDNLGNIDKNIEFCKNVKLDMVYFSYFCIHPSTELYETLKSKRLIAPYELWERYYDIEELKKVPPFNMPPANMLFTKYDVYVLVATCYLSFYTDDILENLERRFHLIVGRTDVLKSIEEFLNSLPEDPILMVSLRKCTKQTLKYVRKSSPALLREISH
ncbi:MAG: B12-binding domain-containing radical SAM protein [Crenarchaeota archaeon]|nr:B12-binding domain-containing radical SAM protein [Thermoproteota archaeon]